MEFLVAFIMLYSVYNYQDETSRVMLLENKKEQNEITISTKKETLSIQNPNTYAYFNHKKKLSKPKQMSQKEIEKRYGKFLATQVKEPKSLLFYFKSGVELDEESKKRLFLIEKEINKRKPASVTIIGHSDTLGTQESNIKLSLKRAKAIKNWMSSNGVYAKELFLESYGENDLLIDTKDEVLEPLNRRVEVLIR